MKRSEAVIQGAPLVHELEEAAMSAVRAAAAATVGLIDLRREANLSAVVGADAWGEMVTTTAHLHQGLLSSLAFHKAMSEVQVRIGCRTVANGGMDKDDSDAERRFGTASAPAPLRAVG